MYLFYLTKVLVNIKKSQLYNSDSLKATASQSMQEQLGNWKVKGFEQHMEE